MVPVQAPTPVARWSQMAAQGGCHLQYAKPIVERRNIGIQALPGLTTVTKRPGGKRRVP